jgi:hypothetical protein
MKKLRVKKQHLKKSPPRKKLTVNLPIDYACATEDAAHSLGMSTSKFLTELMMELINDSKRPRAKKKHD